ncbi:MAG: rhamnogalacturonan acetylesterase [Lachnospiraceae bacterium]|nr:rhamnogalacturonan acetylesterase [Lachnospiraceae bacterium]
MSDGGTTVFLAGDSTVQSYSADNFPQAGWGEMLIRYFARTYRIYPGSAGSTAPCSGFANAVRYEGRGIVVDNRAMGARSVKTYTEEGRLADVLLSLREGDWLLIQFGHNDANREKPERYAEPEEFSQRLFRDFIGPARDKGAHPVLVTPLALMEFDREGVCRPSFPAYREAMLTLGEREKIPVVDLGAKSAQLNTRCGEEACRSLYLWTPRGVFPHWPEGTSDCAHLQGNGAFAFAGLVAKELEKLDGFPIRDEWRAAEDPRSLVDSVSD